jgi:hypothetical protein
MQAMQKRFSALFEEHGLRKFDKFSYWLSEIHKGGEARVHYAAVQLHGDLKEISKNISFLS